MASYDVEIAGIGNDLQSILAAIQQQLGCQFVFESGSNPTINIKVMPQMTGDVNQNTGQNQGVIGSGTQQAGGDINYGTMWKSMESEGHDLSELASELADLKESLKSEASTPEQYQALAEVASAEDAAQRNDGPGVLQKLKTAGKWVFDTATKIGIGVALAAVKEKLGF